ncbi:hypothetical protein ABK040_004235 [Willaertia magna]
MSKKIEDLERYIQTNTNLSTWGHEQVILFMDANSDLISSSTKKKIQKEGWSGMDLVERGASLDFLTKYVKLNTNDSVSFMLAVDKLKKKIDLVKQQQQ